MQNIRLLLTLAVSKLLVGTLLTVRAQVATPTGSASNAAVPVYATRGPYSVGKDLVHAGQRNQQ